MGKNDSPYLIDTLFDDLDKLPPERIEEIKASPDGSKPFIRFIILLWEKARGK